MGADAARRNPGKAYLPGMAGIAAGVLGAVAAAHLPAPRQWVTRSFALLGSVGIAAVLGVLRLFKASGSGSFYGFLWYLPAVGLSWLLGSTIAHFVSGLTEHIVRRVAAPRPLVKDQPAC